MTNDELTMLAFDATSCLVAQIPVTITHPADWEREDFPLPMKRGVTAPDGSLTQNYRPLAILEHVNHKLRGKV